MFPIGMGKPPRNYTYKMEIHSIKIVPCSVPYTELGT